MRISVRWAAGVVLAVAAFAAVGVPGPAPVRSAHAADPAPPAPSPTPPPAGLTFKLPATFQVPVGQPVVLSPETNAKRVSYLVLDPGLMSFPREEQKNPNRLICWSVADNRKYRVVVFASLNDEHAITETTIVVGTPAPPAPPGPTPGPTPPGPTPPPAPPAPAKLVVLVIENTDAAVANRGLVFNDPALRARMKAKGHTFRIVDKDVQDADGKTPGDIARFVPLTSGKAFPQVFLVRPEGDFTQFDWDGKPDTLIAKLAAAGG